MDVNSWLTIITVFGAVLAFLPSHERNLIQLKINKTEIWGSITILLFLIPYLVYFDQLKQRWTWLQTFTVSNGFDPRNIAFALFYFVFLWFLVRVFWIRPTNKVNEKVIAYLKTMMTELPFPQFFSLFIKYTPKRMSNKAYEYYSGLILYPEFLKGIITYRPYYMLHTWAFFNNEERFKTVLGLYISNPSSPYYSELKEHWNSYSVTSDSPFLQTVLVNQLKQSIDNGLLPIISDICKTHLQAEKSKSNSVYRQPHLYYHIREEEGYDLPIYYHIQFISLLYSTAINNHIDVHSISNRYGNMSTLYPGIIKDLIEFIDEQQEGKSNAQWLISEMFSNANHWMEKFGEVDSSDNETKYPYFSTKSSYTDYTPFTISIGLAELYIGMKRRKISPQFIIQKLYYSTLSYYFNVLAIDDIRDSIEKNIIANIPPRLLDDAIDFALDESYASSIEIFKQKHFRGNDAEMKIQKRLWEFLYSDLK